MSLKLVRFAKRDGLIGQGCLKHRDNPEGVNGR
jgi:hypothetical protein